MDRSRAVVFVGLLAVLAPLAGVTASSAATVDHASLDGATGTVDGDRTGKVVTVGLTQEFALLPARAGRVQATRQFALPNDVASIRTTLPDSAGNVATSGGFERVGDGRYEWDGGSQTPSITYSVAVNRTGSASGPEGTSGRYRFADAGDWALFQRPGAPVDVRYYGDSVAFDRDLATVGEGAAGETMVFLGDHGEATRTAHGQTVRLVVPAAADLAETRPAILDSVADASDTLRVGDRDESVFLVAAPTSVDWSVEGLQVGDSDAYVTADERLDTAHNTWLHEYVHTRQQFNLTDGTKWVAEASATYYAALLTLQQRRIGFGEFERALAKGEHRTYDDVVLAEPRTWHDGAAYRKGGLVAGELDREIRLATDAGATFQGVFGELNSRARAVSGDEFVSMVRAAGGDHVATEADRYTTTTTGPSTWDLAAHREAFGTTPARIEYDVPDDGLGVVGQYRNRTLSGASLSLVTGEQLRVRVHVVNAGGATGDYRVTARVDGEVATTAAGRLEPGAETTETVTVPFDTPGSHTLAVGGRTLTVDVGPAADLQVTKLVTNRSTVAPGEPVELGLTVENRADRPGTKDLQVTRDGSVVATKRVTLDAGETRVVPVVVTPTESGTVGYRVADVSVSVSVSGGTGITGPGFGVVAALLALVVLVSAGLARRR
ncbi:CARDB domain-containing protein [Halobacteriales archaeon Cl-PHB]